MAVQQNKKSPSKRGMHRAHDFLTNPPTAVEPITLTFGRSAWSSRQQRERSASYAGAPAVFGQNCGELASFQTTTSRNGTRLSTCRRKLQY